MKKIKILICTILALATGLVSSCTEDFKEMNTDPNRTVAATPESLLAPAIHDMVVRNQNRALRLTNELMQVHVTTSNSDEIHRYVVRPGESDYMWNNWYLQRTNFLNMYNSAEKTNHKSFMGIAQILDVWTASLITDTFGDVPYSEANRGREEIYQPKFDAQKDIYTDLFRKLEEANELLKANQPILDEQLILDPIYGRHLAGVTDGDIKTVALWRKFGNSLYLRLLMRASGKNEPVAMGMTPAEKIKEIVETKKVDYPIFTSNEESAILRFTNTPPLISAFFYFTDFSFNGSHGYSEFFINNLNDWDDPRRTRLATISSGTYIGIPSGYPVGQVPERQSTYLPALKNEPLLGNIMNYPELQFILAEAALKGFISTDPKTYYEKGVESALTLWGVTVPTDHLQKEEVSWETAMDFDEQMEKIMLQKYYTLFFTDFQQWFEYRRTGHPILPKGSGLQNGGLMPSRLKYPVYVQSQNGANYSLAVAAMGGDDLNTKMWWQKN